MRIEALLGPEELRTSVAALLPARIELDDDPETNRALALGSATSCRIVEGVGLEVACPAEVRWSDAIVFRLDELRVTLVPSIEARDGRPVLALRLAVQHADFARLPDLVDSAITALLDHVLDSRPVVVEVGRFLSHVFVLPERIDPSRAVDLSAREATCRVDVDGFHLAVLVDVGVARTTVGAGAGLRESGRAPAPARKAKYVA